MNDTLLGALSSDEDIQGALKGVIVYEGAEVAVLIDPDGGDLSSCLSLARAAVASLGVVDGKARDVAANSLLATFNTFWRNYQEPDGKGGYKEISNPEINASEFRSRLTLTCISVTGKASCCLQYDDGDLFWGHAVLVTSADGVEFSDVHAELYG